MSRADAALHWVARSGCWLVRHRRGPDLVVRGLWRRRGFPCLVWRQIRGALRDTSGSAATTPSPRTGRVIAEVIAILYGGARVAQGDVRGQGALSQERGLVRAAAPGDLRVDLYDGVVARVEQALGVRLDRAALLRKRRTISACSDRGTWVRIEARPVSGL